MESSYQISTNQIALLLVTHFGYLVSLFDADTVYYLLGKQFHVMCKVKKKFTRGMNWL